MDAFLNENNKSKNQLYREYRYSGGSLSFKDWMHEHLRASVEHAIVESEYLNYDGQANYDGSAVAGTDVPFKPVLENTTFLGIPNAILYGALVTAGLYAVYKIYNKQ